MLYLTFITHKVESVPNQSSGVIETYFYSDSYVFYQNKLFVQSNKLFKEVLVDWCGLLLIIYHVRSSFPLSSCLVHTLSETSVVGFW